MYSFISIINSFIHFRVWNIYELEEVLGICPRKSNTHILCITIGVPKFCSSPERIILNFYMTAEVSLELRITTIKMHSVQYLGEMNQNRCDG